MEGDLNMEQLGRGDRKFVSWLLILAFVLTTIGSGLVPADTAEAKTGAKKAARIAAGSGRTSGAATGVALGIVRYANGYAVTGTALNVTLTKKTGSKLRAAIPSATTDPSSGEFTFTNIDPGDYTIETEMDDGSGRKKSISKPVTLYRNEDGTNNYSYKEDKATKTVENKSLELMLPEESSTYVAVESDNGAVVDDKSLIDQFSEPFATPDIEGITQEDKTKLDAGGEIRLELEVDDLDLTDTMATEYTTEKPAVDSRAESERYSITNYYDIDLEKKVKAAGDASYTETDLTGSNKLINIEIPVKDVDTSRYSYRVYRYHGGAAESLATTANADGEYFEITNDDQMLTLHVKKFCVYALAYYVAPIYYPPVVTPKPTEAPTAEPTMKPTTEPTEAPTAEPTGTPEEAPTTEPATEPTVKPTEAPTATASPAPEASTEPTAEPAATKEPAKTAKPVLLLEVAKSNATSMTLTWNKISGADGYDLYHSKCNTKTKTRKLKFYKTFKSGKTHRFTFKGMKRDQWYKDKVVAWKMVGGEKVILAKSLVIHQYLNKKNADTKWGNPTKVKLSKTSLSLAKGKSAKLGGKAVVAKGKDLGRHGKRIRYVVSDPLIATVSEKGKVKAKKKGICTIYVVAQNGMYKKVKVKIKSKK